MNEQANAMYQKFRSSQQAAVRLELALNGYFTENVFTPQQTQAFADYLKLRIRPALQSLIDQENTDKILYMDTQGWISAALVEEGLLHAIRLKKTQAFLCLLKIKADKHGFHDRKFDLI
jgi:hypothetical protein